MDQVYERLSHDLKDPEYRRLYAENLLNASVAAQIKTIREQRKWTQSQLAKEAKMQQSTISEMEDPDYSSWTLRTLRRLAKAFDVRLKVTFEEYGTLLPELDSLTTKALQRRPFSSDPVFAATVQTMRAKVLPFSLVRRGLAYEAQQPIDGGGRVIDSLSLTSRPKRQVQSIGEPNQLVPSVKQIPPKMDLGVFDVPEVFERNTTC